MGAGGVIPPPKTYFEKVSAGEFLVSLISSETIVSPCIGYYAKIKNLMLCLLGGEANKREKK